MTTEFPFGKFYPQLTKRYKIKTVMFLAAVLYKAVRTQDSKSLPVKLSRKTLYKLTGNKSGWSQAQNLSPLKKDGILEVKMDGGPPPSRFVVVHFDALDKVLAEEVNKAEKKKNKKALQKTEKTEKKKEKKLKKKLALIGR